MMERLNLSMLEFIDWIQPLQKEDWEQYYIFIFGANPLNAFGKLDLIYEHKRFIKNDTRGEN